MKKTAWVAGASGLVGNELIRQLAKHPGYEKVVALVRKEQANKWNDLNKVEQWLIDYEDLCATSRAEQVDDLFCALGSTTRKTPDKALYRRIDVHYPREFARLGLQQGARSFALVSAHGSNPKSLSHYLKMKGELEASLQALRYPNLVIVRPGLLRGERKEFRPGERIAEVITCFLPGNFRAIQAFDVASAMIESCNKKQPGQTTTTILSSAQMQGCASKTKGH